MPRTRKRVGKGGKALPCRVNLTPQLSQFLYRERLRGGYRDETDLVCAIVRAWAEKLDPMNWPAVLAELRAEEGGPKGK